MTQSARHLQMVDDGAGQVRVESQSRLILDALPFLSSRLPVLRTHECSTRWDRPTTLLGQKVASRMATRVQWSSLPLHLTRWAEQELGGSVVHAASQTSGFSSGSADRVQTQNGRRAFMKAVSRDRNSGTFELHRREADVMRKLPASIPAPTMLDVFDDDE